MYDAVAVPAGFWDRSDVIEALRERDIASLFLLLRDVGVSKVHIATMVGMNPGRVGTIMSRRALVVTALSTFERIAAGLAMPDHARITLGLAPARATSHQHPEPPAEPVTAAQIRAARLALGRQLAAWRDAAQFTQAELAHRVYYSRSTVAVVETGRQNVGRQFWQRADTHLGADGLLLKAFEQVAALVREHNRQFARAREREHQRSGCCGCAVTVARWTGLDVRALREAMRLPVRAFADRLGFSVATVTGWESARLTRPLALDAQETLDLTLKLADPDTRSRFAHLQSSALRGEPPAPPAGAR